MGHLQGAGDGGCGHDQKFRAFWTGFCLQGKPLFNTEAVLFIDDSKGEVFENHV